MTIRAYRLQHQILMREVGDVGLAAVTLDLLRTHLTHHGHLQSSSLGHKIRAIKGLSLPTRAKFLHSRPP